MRIGLHVNKFAWPHGPAKIGPTLARIARSADEAGFATLSVMDHLWQIEWNGPPEEAMLESYTTLGFLAAHTRRIELLTWVSAVVYREPGLLAKIVTTLDVLSEGRAWLGIGAAWNVDEAIGLGLPFPSTAERFERLEEALQIFIQMCGESEEPFVGRHYRLGRTLNMPQPLRRPHPPILVAGLGERKTLRLVAQYAQACNLVPGPELSHKLDVLRGHCDALGRDYDEIQKTVIMPLDPGPDGRGTAELLDRLRDLAALGIDHVQGAIPDVATIRPIELFAEKIIPAASEL